MKQWTNKQFYKLLSKNGFTYNRCSGGHHIWVNNHGDHISVPSKLKCVIANRLIKENNLIDV